MAKLAELPNAFFEGSRPVCCATLRKLLESFGPHLMLTCPSASSHPACKDERLYFGEFACALHLAALRREARKGRDAL